MTKLDEFRAAEEQSPAAANRLLFTWLSDDHARAELYKCLWRTKDVLKFRSRAGTKEWRTENIPSVFHQEVYLLANWEHVKEALTDRKNFSSSPYKALGSGTFMLGLNDGSNHTEQRAFASEYLGYDAWTIAALASVAFDAGAVLPSKQRNFDLVDASEQVALHFAGFLFGFEQADHVLLQETMRAASFGADYQIMGRHFVSEPAAVPDASIALGALLERVAQLIDIYRARIGQTEEDTYQRLGLELEELRQEMGKSTGSQPPEFEPVLRRIAKGTLSGGQVDYSGNELAVIVVGLIAGSISNIQAAASIAINEFFRDPALMALAHAAAVNWQLDKKDDGSVLIDRIWQALRLNPPVPFLPRKTENKIRVGSTDIPEHSNLILAVGGATQDPNSLNASRGEKDSLIFGGGDGAFLHRCVGRHLAMPVIARIVRGVLLLDGLAQTHNPRTGELYPLEKLWGVNCKKYPLQFNRTSVLTQFPLIVIMKVKTPVAVHAEALKEIIKYGAPKIEKKLRDAGHVHFAWFLFIENDTKLMMSTIYDRDFDSYIEYFALEIGSMFDLVFQHIQDPPPMPVSEFPKEFVDTIRRYNNRTAAGYFFSAYPMADVARISHDYPPEDP
jgi:cytochrome P450